MAKRKLPKFVVGLGASAGGLEALESFFGKTPNDSGAAFVVVMHLSRDFKSMLDELLARHTKMSVKPIIDGEKLQANTVYIIQPATTIELSGNQFKVQSRPIVDFVGAVSTIDDFFRSLANSWGEKSCGIVLSGSGSDGAEGIISIRQAGGFTCAQSPETAKFDSMPLAAISTNSVRAIDAPDQLGAIAVDGMLFPSAEPYVAIISDHDKALAKILSAVVGISDIDAGQYKHSMFERRVRKRMMHLQIGSLTAYADLVEEDLIEAKTLADTLLIGVTEFFRDEKAFLVVKQQIIPELIQQAQTENSTIRIWTPGCATGQEAYSIAMLFAEAFEGLPISLEVQIFATDIKRDFLGIAARGEFTEEQVGSVPEHLRSKFFSHSTETGLYQIDPDIRKMIVFAPHDVISDPPFTRLDMVCCRNLLIYFSIEAQQKILGGFAFGLNEKGILFLGSSETVGAQRESFEFIDAKNRIFRRTSQRRVSPTSNTTNLGVPLQGSSRIGTSRRTVKLREAALQPAYTALLNEYAPPSLLLSAERELLHSFGNARAYLRPPDGVAHFDAADMVDKALRSPLIAGVERCLRDKAAINFTKIKLDQFPEVGAFVDIELKPLMAEETSDPTHVLVIIDPATYVKKEEKPKTVAVISSDKLSEERIEKLELELDRTREALQATIEEIETTNEELQSSNEELMSSNEELQSTNEELSSVNEELYSVNAEYHRQNDELTNLSSDFDLLLQSTEIGVVFLDKDLNITRFTALARDIFNLAETDVGRSISTFRSPFKGVDPDSLVFEALSKNDIVEVEVIDNDGVAWLVRSVAHEGRLGGAVLTIINIGRLREAEAENRRTNNMLQSMQRITESFFYEMSHGNWNIRREVGLSEVIGAEKSIVGKPLDEKMIHEDDREIMEALYDKSSSDEELLFQARLWHAKSKSYRYIKFIALKTNDNVWYVTGMDVDALVRAQNELEAREAIFEGVLRASPSLVSFIGKDQRYLYVNHAYEKQWGEPSESIIGKTVKEFLPSNVYAQAEPRIKEALEGKRQNYIVTNEDETGEKITLSVVYEPVFDADKNVTGFVTDVLDVTKYFKHSKIIQTFEELIGSASNEYHYSVLIIDTKSLVVDYANPSGLIRLGFNADQEIPEGIKVSKLTPTWGDKSWYNWLKNNQSEKDLIKRDISVFDLNGSSFAADIAATRINVEGKEKAVIRIFDNSDRIVALQDLQSRSEELALSNRDLEQFASVVAHDLRAPLRHITQFSSMMKDEVDGTSETIPEYLDIIASSASKMSDMVDGLLSYARLGRERPFFEDVSLTACVKSAKELLAKEIKDSGAKIEAKSLGKVFGDEALLTRLLQNLIGNAIKYRVEGKRPKIKIETLKTEDHVVLSVEDNGIGIAPEYAQNIFKLFGRLHSDNEYEGLGVGLATCQRIAEFHNGTINLDFSYEGGSRFVVKMPFE